MSHATDQARSTRDDARAFADAFAGAEELFADASRGESRTLTLTELEAVLELDGPVDVAAPRQPAPSRPPAAEVAEQVPGGEGLMTLDELGELLARPAASADVLDFDFGPGATERARLRTAARAGSADAGTAGAAVTGTSPADDVTRAAAAPVRPLAPVSHGSTMATPLLAPTNLTNRVATPFVSPAPASRRTLPGSGTVQRLRADPDRIALYAVLLGILLVLIAASSSASA